MRASGIDPNAAKREEKQAKLAAAQNTFEAVGRAWLAKTKANRAATTQKKVTIQLDKDLFPCIGNLPITSIGPRDVLAAVRKLEGRGAFDSAHQVKQLAGRVFRFAVAEGSAERDVTADLKGALSSVPEKHYAALTEPKRVGELMRSIYGYSGHPYAVAALKLTPILFARPGELRTAEWVEFNLEAGEWNIPAPKMKMRTAHLVPLSTQAVTILREIQVLTGHGKYVFPSIRTGERSMSVSAD